MSTQDGNMKLVLVSAGHSNRDPGAVNPALGLHEADLTVDLRNMIAFYLARDGVPFITDGEGAENKTLNDAIKLARQADIAIELHFNAAANKTVKGIEVLAAEKDRMLAQRIAGAIHSVTKSPLRGDKGYKPENAGQHARLGFVRSGGLVVEVEFISNDGYIQSYLDVKWLVAREIAGVLKAEALGL